MEEMEWHKH